MSRPAPIALFAWRRPDHLRRVLESLAECRTSRDSALVVFCDGPREESHRQAVEDVQGVLQEFRGVFRTMEIVRRDSNVGLAANIISGVGSLVGEFGRVVVLEDDLVVAPSFLDWMNEGLQRYEDCPRVASVHGYVYPVEGTLPESFFLRGADCWGWATWERAWRHFRPEGELLLRELEDRGLAHGFDWEGAFGYSEMLRDQIAGRNDSWAVRWHASAFLQDMLTLYPGRSLVENIGHDDSGTHSGSSRAYDVALSTRPPASYPESLEESPRARHEIREFLWKASGRRRPIMDRFRSRLGRPR
ncbi:MAG: glycosyltransferase [Fibrobacteria bacterium]|nr:glycosyltransferase [Fibrobacteria bacterium]